MNQTKAVATETQKKREAQSQSAREPSQAGERMGGHSVMAQAAYQRMRVNPTLFRPADVIALQRAIGNRQVQQIVAGSPRNHSPLRIQREPETWFRGEAEGVMPARAGGVIHDFGDGLYLTNDSQVAGEYARLRAGEQPETGRVLGATFARAELGRVLDLNQDVRWQQFVRTPSPGGITYEQLIRQANENYSRFFGAFLQQNNLRLEDFDTVIGPEYVRGGTQMCIRNPSIAGRIRAFLQPLTPQRPLNQGSGASLTGPTPSPTPSEGSRFGTGAKVVAGGLGLLMVLNEILAPIGQALAVQRRNIEMGRAQLEFWTRFGGRPVSGIWSQNERRALPAGTEPSTGIFGSPSFPYVVDIDAAAFRSTLPSLIRNYQDFLLFLDLAKSLGTLIEEPPLPRFPTREERREQRRYMTYVSGPDAANRKSYDFTDVIAQMRARTLSQLDESMRERVRALSPEQQRNIFRLKLGSETPIFRSAHGGQPIYSSRQVFGPEPWVRTLGQHVEGGVWSWFAHGHAGDRVLVVPANADAQRSALVSAYPIKQPIGDTYDEVRASRRPILQRQPPDGSLQSFVAGPEPGDSSRFGETRYYRHPEFPYQWTAAIGELHQFWVNAEDLEPVAQTNVANYARGSPAR